MKNDENNSVLGLQTAKPVAAKSATVKPAVARVATKKGSDANPKPKRTFPQYSIEECRVIADKIKMLNAGNPWAPRDIATALSMGTGNNFFYLTQSSRDYQLTLGTRDTDKIELTDIGRRLVYPKTPEEEYSAILDAFLSIGLFKKVYDYYQGENLPDIQYLKNTLKVEFEVDDEFQDDFYQIFQKNITYLKSKVFEENSGAIKKNEVHKAKEKSGNIMLGESSQKSGLVAFVAMPFSEKTSAYAKGYFDEVLKRLITPAAVKANFDAKTAKKAGSDVIQSTIVNDLDDADLVIVDLTEHNPNVLFELGIRIAFNKPVCLIRAKGTAPIFDIDHMLRVYDYEPNLWPSTLELDVPALCDHILETWKNKDSRSYLSILRENKD